MDDFLDSLTHLTKEDDQVAAFSKIVPKCTPGIVPYCILFPPPLPYTSITDDLKWLCKIIDHDLKINIGAKFVLNALHPDAFEGFFFFFFRRLHSC
jgi:DNA ligase-3